MYPDCSPSDMVAAPLTSADDYDCQPAGAAWHYTDRVDPRLRAHAEYVQQTRQAAQARREAERATVPPPCVWCGAAFVAGEGAVFAPSAAGAAWMHPRCADAYDALAEECAPEAVEYAVQRLAA